MEADCDDGNALTSPGAPEANDGIDNQCPGDMGFGLIDEIGPSLGYWVLGNNVLLSWDRQLNADAYEIVRSSSRAFAAGCGTWGGHS
jgi:hypothetical protein